MQRKWWTLLLVSLATFMLLLDITVVNVALPSIRQDLGASFTDLQWVVDAYALTLAALVLAAGSLADRLGRRRLFAAGLVIFSAASLLCALAPDPTLLSLARALQGVGGAVLFAVSLALVAQEFPAGPQRGTAMGLYGATIGMAVAIGPLVGGALTDGLGWRDGGPVAGERPRQQGAAGQQPGRAAGADHDAFGQLASHRRPGHLPARARVDPLGVQARVDLGGARPLRQPVRATPRLGEGDEVGAAAVRARAVPRRQRGRLVQEEQRRPATRRHRVAPHALPVQHAADPQLRPPAGHAQPAVRPVQAAAVAHQQAASRVGDDLPGGGDAVLQRHYSSTGAPSSSTRSVAPPSCSSCR